MKIKKTIQAVLKNKNKINKVKKELSFERLDFIRHSRAINRQIQTILLKIVIIKY